MIFLRTTAVAAWVALACAASAADIYFSYAGDEPGVGRVKVADGKLVGVETLTGGLAVAEPFKLAYAAGAGVIGVATGGSDEPGILLVPTNEGASLPSPLNVSMPAAVSDLAATDDTFFVAASKGRFVTVDARTGSLAAEFNARKLMDPPGRKGEHIRLLPGGKQAFVSFQKDDDNSPAQGNRIALFDLDPLQIRADLLLPRDRPDLHIAQDPKEQGPGPEIVIVCPRSDTLAVTLDLYGAIAFADLGAALKGRLDKVTYVPTAEDGGWGGSFPDRATLFEVSNREYLLISNAAENGGFTLFDVSARKPIFHAPAPAGADPPVFLPAIQKAVSVVSGKVKSRTPDGLNKEARPDTNLYLFDMAPLARKAQPTINTVDLGLTTRRIAAAGDRSVVVFGDDEVLLLDATDATILDRKPLPGPVVRALAVP